MYADDVKIYREVRTDADAVLLYDDLTRLVEDSDSDSFISNKSTARWLFTIARQLTRDIAGTSTSHAFIYRLSYTGWGSIIGNAFWALIMSRHDIILINYSMAMKRPKVVHHLT